MFRFDLDKWERFSDRINPIMIRDYRRMKFDPVGLLAFYLILLGVGLFLWIVFLLSPGREMIQSFIGLFYCFCFGIILGGGIFLSFFAPIAFYTSTKIEDNLLSQTLLSPKTEVHGYLWESLFGTLITVLPSIPFCYLAHQNGLITELPDYSPGGWFLVILFVLEPVLMLYFLSFCARASSPAERSTAVSVSLFILVLMLSPWIIIPEPAVLSLLRFDSLNYSGYVGDLLYWVVYPGTLLLIGLAGYVLSRIHVAWRRESFWCSMIVNTVVYLSLGLFFAVVVFLAHLARILSPFGC